jgi:hypothetical protein
MDLFITHDMCLFHESFVIEMQSPDTGKNTSVSYPRKNGVCNISPCGVQGYQVIRCRTNSRQTPEAGVARAAPLQAQGERGMQTGQGFS